MKGVLATIHVRDFGRIADAEIQLRPFTVFIGPNNTNKTWVASAIHGLVQSLSVSRFFFRTNSAMAPVSGFQGPAAVGSVCASVAERLTHDLLSRSNGATYRTSIYRAELLEQTDIAEVVEFSIDSDGLAGLLGTHQLPSSQASVALRMPRRDFLHGGFIHQLEMRFDRPDGRLWITPTASDGTRRYQSNAGYGTAVGIEGDVQRAIYEHARWMALGVFQGSAAFPAERNGLLSTYRLIDPAREPGGFLSHVSRDFVNLLRDADIGRRSDGGPCRHINRTLENTMLQGALAFDPSQESSAMTYTVSGGPTVGVEAAASLVRSLAGLYCYFRISALEQDLIIMDEPEMNAHPEAQLRLLEFFAELVNRRFRVLLTTHSPYMVDHLNNLVALSKVPVPKRQEVPIEYRGGLDPDDVAVYLFTEEGRVIDVFDREENVLNLETFSGPSDRVSNLYSEILRLQARS